MRTVQRPSVRPRRAAPRRAAPAVRVACIVCGVEETPANTRLEAWQSSPGGSDPHCRSCAELLLDDVVLAWAGCGHADTDGVVLYDRPVCVLCEAG